MLKNKIDFAVVFTVNNANPNGDPLVEGRPRQTINGLGEVTSVCIKRKIRNRFHDFDENIFVKQLDRIDSSVTSLKEILTAETDLYELYKNKEQDKFLEEASKRWLDVRTFGQVFAFKGEKQSMNCKGAVSIQNAYSVNEIMIEDKQIAKNINSVKAATANSKTSDTMGWYYSVPFGLYVVYGSVSPLIANKNGFSEDDVELLKDALCSLFENDASVSRPSGSMEVKNVYWWEHSKKHGNASSAKVHQLLKINPLVDFPTKYEDYEFILDEKEGITCEVLEGF